VDFPAAPNDRDALSRLRTIGEVAERIGADAAMRDARDLLTRVGEGRFFVACLGQFKRGKSSLLNALIGESLLPTGVVPVTSAITILRHGASGHAHIQYEDGRSDDVSVSRLPEYVTEAGNPDNGKCVAAIEVFHSSELLKNGLCLVDTPGLGSASPLATATTRAFVPRIDAAVVVLGADPPVTGAELEMLRDVTQETQRLVFVLNKADKLSDAEGAEVLVFTTRLLTDSLGVVPDHLFVVSATERSQSGRPTRDWHRLEAVLTSWGEHAKADVLLARAIRTADRLSVQVLHAIDEGIAALVRPVDESDRRLRQLQAWLADAERAVGDLGVLLAAEQQTIARSMRAEVEHRVARNREAVAIDLRKAVDGALESGGAHVRHTALSAAQGIANRVIRRELEAEEERTRVVYQQATRRFVNLANALLDRLAAAESRLAELPRIVEPADLGGTRRFHFSNIMRLTGTRPWDLLLDHVAPRGIRRRRILTHAEAYLHHLLETNASRVAGDLEDRLRDSRALLEHEVRARLAALATSAERAATRAKDARNVGATAVRDEIRRLRELRTRIASPGDAASLAPHTASPRS
jgi:GTP-binding protein EngB required for normal cell division